MKSISTLYKIKGTRYGEVLLESASFKMFKKAFPIASYGIIQINDEFSIKDPFGNFVKCKVKTVDFSFFREPKKDKDGIKYVAEVSIWVDISDNVDYQMQLLGPL